MIIKENMLKEDGKYYVMMKAVKTSASSNVKDKLIYQLIKPEHIYYWKSCFLRKRNPVLLEYLDKQKEQHV